VGGWAADRIGRINGLFYAAIFALVGGALQAATQGSDFILVARVVTGLGTGALTGITPVLVSEVSSAEHRGGFLGYVFIANYLGTVFPTLVRESHALTNVDRYFRSVLARLWLVFRQPRILSSALALPPRFPMSARPPPPRRHQDAARFSPLPRFSG
jgi:MFS family permease